MSVVIYAGQICNQCANNFIKLNNDNSNNNTCKNVNNYNNAKINIQIG